MTTTDTVNNIAIRNGQPRPGGRLDSFIASQDPRNAPIIEGDLAFVSVEGEHPRKAVLHREDFQRLTKDPSGPRLTRSRWFLDGDGYLRAFSLHDKHKFVEGVLVAAAVLGVKTGDTIEIPADPFDLRLGKLKKVACGPWTRRVFLGAGA
jgi:hypothetical protein